MQWGGVVDDATMQAFFNRTLYAPLPEFPVVSSFTTLNPASSGRRSLLRVTQLVLPFRVGRVDVAHDSATAWTVATVNVARLDIAAGAGSSRLLPKSLIIDGASRTVRAAACSARCCPLARDYEAVSTLGFSVSLIG